MSDLFGRRAFRTLVRDTHEQLGHDCTADELVDAMRRSITLDEYQAWSEPAFRRAVLSAAKSHVTSDGIDSVYESGGRIQALRLFSVEQFEDKARELARQSAANFEAIRALARVCAEVHGHSFDAERVIAEVAA